jgi:flagellar assembly protein FliH
VARIIKSTEAEAGVFARFERNVLEEPSLDSAVPEEDAEANFESEAERVLARAHTEAQLIRAAAYDEGRQEGQGAAADEFRRNVAESEQAFAHAIEAIRRSHEEFVASLEPDVLRMIGAITLRILNREARLDPLVVQQTVRNALENLVQRERVTVRLNPADFAAMREQSIDLGARVEGIVDLIVAPDDSVGLGGCVVETDALTIDARLDRQLERILSGLSD